MNNPASNRDTLPLFALKRLDQICDRFEAVWNAGQQPQIEEHLLAVFGEDHEAYLRRINDPANNRFPITILSIVEHTRNRIQEEYALDNKTIFSRGNHGMSPD